MQVRNLKWVATIFIFGAITLTVSKLGASTSKVTIQALSSQSVIQLIQNALGQFKSETNTTCPLNSEFSGFKSITISPDGESLTAIFFTDTGRRIKHWSLLTGEEISLPFTIATEISESPNSFLQYFFLEKTTFTSDGSTLIGIYYDIVYSEAIVKLWDSTTGEETQKSYVNFDPNNEAIGTVEISVSLDSSVLAWIGRNTDTDIVSITLWDIQTGETTHTYNLNSLNRDIAVASISSSNPALLIAKFDGTVDLLDLATGRTIQSSAIGYMLEVVALHSNGKTLFGVDHNNDTIGIWDTTTAELIGVLEGHVSPIDFLAFNLNDAILLSGSRDGMIKLWEPPGREIRTICAV